MKFDINGLASAIRAKRGDISLGRIAESVGVGASTLSRIENKKLLDIETFAILCDWLNVNPNLFFIDIDAHSDFLSEIRLILKRVCVDEKTVDAFIWILAKVAKGMNLSIGGGEVTGFHGEIALTLCDYCRMDLSKIKKVKIPKAPLQFCDLCQGSDLVFPDGFVRFKIENVSEMKDYTEHTVSVREGV